MTSTIQGSNPTAPRRGRFRIASMEALGFIDNPGTASTWATTPNDLQVITTSPSTPTVDPFTDWQPTEVGSRLLRGRIRWGLLLVTLMMAVGIVAIGLWLYQRPAALAAEAMLEVQASASVLTPELVTALELNNSLLDQDPVPATVIASLLTLDAQARDLFEASAMLPSSEAASRIRAADAASEALDASRLLGTSYAYRAAVIPILAVPGFETDPSLVALDEAARRFGEWQAKFDSVRSALPAGSMPPVTAELAVISGDLDSLQSRYLDAVRKGDMLETIKVIEDLRGRLTVVEGMLFSGLSEVQERIQSRIDQALSTIESLVG